MVYVLGYKINEKVFINLRDIVKYEVKIMRYLTQIEVLCNNVRSSDLTR